MNRGWLRSLAPPDLRRLMHSRPGELVVRVRDSVPDILGLLFAKRSRLPPPGLRRNVVGTSSRRAFRRTGEGSFYDLARSFTSARDPARPYPNWLDFGCGCGRVARHLVRLPDVRRLVGVDVDGEMVDWCRDHLEGIYQRIGPDPPMRFATGEFDVAYAGSVFTHLDESRQLEWLREIHRTLRADGGLLIASTHSPKLTVKRRDLSPAKFQQLESIGFLFAAGAGAFKDDTSFHSRDYLVATWGRLFQLLRYEPFGLNGYQDLHVWRKF